MWEVPVAQAVQAPCQLLWRSLQSQDHCPLLRYLLLESRDHHPHQQINKTFNNIKITILCGFVTILVLRGTIGVNFGSSDADAVNQNLIEETNWILAEIRSDGGPSDPDEPTDNPSIISSTRRRKLSFSRA